LGREVLECLSFCASEGLSKAIVQSLIYFISKSKLEVGARTERCDSDAMITTIELAPATTPRPEAPIVNEASLPPETYSFLKKFVVERMLAKRWFLHSVFGVSATLAVIAWKKKLLKVTKFRLGVFVVVFRWFYLCLISGQRKLTSPVLHLSPVPQASVAELPQFVPLSPRPTLPHSTLSNLCAPLASSPIRRLSFPSPLHSLISHHSHHVPQFSFPGPPPINLVAFLPPNYSAYGNSETSGLSGFLPVDISLEDDTDCVWDLLKTLSLLVVRHEPFFGAASVHRLLQQVR
jgi:hypothetical protein